MVTNGVVVNGVVYGPDLDAVPQPVNIVYFFDTSSNCIAVPPVFALHAKGTQTVGETVSANQREAMAGNGVQWTRLGQWTLATSNAIGAAADRPVIARVITPSSPRGGVMSTITSLPFDASRRTASRHQSTGIKPASESFSTIP